MKKLIILISDGPMGSTTLSSIIGNCKFLTFPLRHLGLNKYVSGEYSLDNPFFIKRVEECINSLSKKRLIGGRSVLERDKREQILFDDRIKNEINKLKEKKFNSISEMYFYTYELFNKYCKYKNKIDNYLGVVELATDIHLYKPEEIQKCYYNSFKSVQYISLKRKLDNWINAICSQRFHKKNFKLKYFFIRLSSQIKRYKKYNNFVDQMSNNLVISFEKIFEKEFLKNFLIQADLDLNKNFEKLDFDHYGRLLKYKETFEPVDDKFFFLGKTSFKIINYAHKKNENKFIRLLMDILFQIFYLKDHIRYLIIKKPNIR